VIGGPFERLLYCDEACGSMLGPKLLGVYELELQQTIRSVLRDTYEHVTDIGAAEGYYAVGLLRAMPKLRVTAFESTPAGRRAMRCMAKRNGVAQRLTILGTCDTLQLQNALNSAGRALVICDLEGAEDHLLDPRELRGLNRTDMLVELHDFVDIGISPRIAQRFSVTHGITRFRSTRREYRDLPGVAGLDKRQLLFLASERRPCVMEWFWLRSTMTERENHAFV
jgi:hypothetical protein